MFINIKWEYIQLREFILLYPAQKYRIVIGSRLSYEVMLGDMTSMI